MQTTASIIFTTLILITCIFFSAALFLNASPAILGTLFFIVVILWAIERYRSHNKKGLLAKKRHEDLEMARRVQETFLLNAESEMEGLKIAKKCIAADNVGGDFYTITTQNYEAFASNKNIPGVVTYTQKETPYLALSIGDVAGHGIPSALVMALTAGLFSELSQKLHSPAKVLSHINNRLYQHIQGSQIRFVTSFYMIYAPLTKVLSFSRAGHPSGLLLRSNGTVESLDTDGIVMGLYDDEAFEEKQIQITSKDRLLLFTDGITESFNKTREEFGLDRLQKLFVETQQIPIDDALSFIFNQVNVFSKEAKQQDDQTLILVEFE